MGPVRLCSGEREYEVSKPTLAAALADLLGVVVTGGDTLAEQAARRLVVNVLRADGATWPQLGELLGVIDPRHLFKNEAPAKSPLWSRWHLGEPQNTEARVMGERLLLRLRNPPTPTAGSLLALDRALAGLAASLDQVRMAIRNMEASP